MKKEQKDFKGHTVLRAQRESRELRDPLVQWVAQGLQERMELQVHEGAKVKQDQWGVRVHVMLL